MVVSNDDDNGNDVMLLAVLAMQAWHERLCNNLQRGEAQHTTLSAQFMTLQAHAETVSFKCAAQLQQLQSSRTSLKKMVADYLLLSSDQRPDIFDVALVNDAIQNYCETTETFFITKTELLEVLDVMSSLVLDNDDGENRGNHDDSSIDEPVGYNALPVVDVTHINLTSEIDICRQVDRLMAYNGRSLDKKLWTTLHQGLARTDHLHNELTKRCRMIQNHAAKATALCQGMVLLVQSARDHVHHIKAASQLPSSTSRQQPPLVFDEVVQAAILATNKHSRMTRQTVEHKHRVVTAELYKEIVGMQRLLDQSKCAHRNMSVYVHVSERWVG